MDRRLTATTPLPGARVLGKPTVQNIYLKDDFTMSGSSVCAIAGTPFTMQFSKDEKITSSIYSGALKSDRDRGLGLQEKTDSNTMLSSFSVAKKGTKNALAVQSSNLMRKANHTIGAVPTVTGIAKATAKLDIESSKGWSNLLNFQQQSQTTQQPSHLQLQLPDDPTKTSLLRRLSDMGPESPLNAMGKRRTLLLPQRKMDEGKLTVVLDMDETLIHSEFMGPVDYRQEEVRQHVSGKRPPDFTIKLYENSAEQDEEIVHVYKRPGLDNFLRKLSEICEPVIFTAALPMYARPILKNIDPKRRCKSRLYRNATVKYAGYPHVKCLKNLGRDLGRVILVDNSPYAMAADPDNAVPIKSFYDDQEDRELEYLYEIVKEMVDIPDVRPHLKRKFNFGETICALLPNA